VGCAFFTLRRDTYSDTLNRFGTQTRQDSRPQCNYRRVGTQPDTGRCSTPSTISRPFRAKHSFITLPGALPSLFYTSSLGPNLECGGRGEERAGDTAFAEPKRHVRIVAHVSRCERTYSLNTILQKSGVAGFVPHPLPPHSKCPIRTAHFPPTRCALRRTSQRYG
jgi:hypothetical protein